MSNATPDDAPADDYDARNRGRMGYWAEKPMNAPEHWPEEFRRSYRRAWIQARTFHADIGTP